MIQNLDTDTAIQITLFGLMLMLHDVGITRAHMGALMRLIGVPNETAQGFDDTYIDLDDGFVQFIKAYTLNFGSEESKTVH